MGAETGRGIRYAQRYFVNASAVERVELRMARSHFANFGKTTQNIKMKTLELHGKYVYTLGGRGFVNASPLEQIELRINMSQTNCDSTIFETDVTRKRTFVKLHLDMHRF